MTKRKSGGLLENVKTIVYAGLIAIGIRTFLLEPFNIPSGSMIPTLLVGDYLFVSKWSYGYSRYRSRSLPICFRVESWAALPKRGDVVVFKLPRDPSVDYIKRVIGLPGDHIQVKDGQLYINGAQVPRQQEGTYTAADEGAAVVGRLYIETLPNGVRHEIRKLTDEGFANNTPEYAVPPDSVFAMGDNRDNSQDSRYLDAVGFIPMENLVGRAEFIFLSINAEYPWWEVWEWPFEIRWNRLFRGIH